MQLRPWMLPSLSWRRITIAIIVGMTTRLVVDRLIINGLNNEYSKLEDEKFHLEVKLDQITASLNNTTYNA